MTNLDWTTERIEKLKELYDAGCTYSKIARQLDVTKNAALSKCNRMGWTRAPKAASSSVKSTTKNRRIPRKPLKESRKSNYGGRANKIARNAAHPPAPFEDRPAPADLVIPLEQRRTLATLTPHTCRFPIGDPRSPDFFYCGAASPFFGYCAQHHARVWVKPKRC